MMEIDSRTTHEHQRWRYFESVSQCSNIGRFERTMNKDLNFTSMSSLRQTIVMGQTRSMVISGNASSRTMKKMRVRRMYVKGRKIYSTFSIGFQL